MGQDEAMATRMDAAQTLVRAANVREGQLLASLAVAIHNPQAVFEAIEASKPETEKTEKASGFNAGLAKLARLRAGNTQAQNEEMAQAIELRARAARLMEIVRGRKNGAD